MSVQLYGFLTSVTNVNKGSNRQVRTVPEILAKFHFSGAQGTVVNFSVDGKNTEIFLQFYNQP